MAAWRGQGAAQVEGELRGLGGQSRWAAQQAAAAAAAARVGRRMQGAAAPPSVLPTGGPRSPKQAVRHLLAQLGFAWH